MNNSNTLAEDLLYRRKRIQSEMQKIGVEACILSTSVNLFYTVGSIFNGYIYIPIEGEPFFFVKRESTTHISGSIYIRKPEQIAEELNKKGVKIPSKILLEVDALSYSECNRIISALNITETVNASTLLRNIRSEKTDFEVEQIKKCAQKHVNVYKQIPSLYKPGMTDLQLQFEIEHLMRISGSIGIFRSYGANMDIYMGSLLVGENAEAPSPFDFALGGQGENPILPLGASGIKIEKGNTIMVDMAGNYSPWMTDITRVFSVGKTSELAYKAHEVSIEIHDAICQIAKVGTACADIYNIALEIVSKNKLEEYFMGTKQQAKFIGHGVGLEINEPPVLTPRSKEVLKENIVFALEPKFVIPTVGAVGIENTYLTTQNGIKNLTILEQKIVDLTNL